MVSGSEDAAADSLVGTVVDDRYRVVRRIGEGGMGAVYEVEHVRIGRRFALKTLHAELARNNEIVTRFHREARAAGTIEDEHIIEVSDMGQLPGGEPFLVMELLEGRDLALEIEQAGPLPLARVMRIAMQSCEALRAAHANGIVHRDLKPENIFLVAGRKEPDFVKLVDFGISKFKESVVGLERSGMTRTGTAMGTPYYMAPEQIEGARDLDGRTDVYAFGVVLFEALSGRVPFDAPAYPALVVKITHETPPSLRSLRSDVPRELEAVVYRAMAKKRDERFQSMEELASALAPFGDESRAIPEVNGSVRALGTTATPSTPQEPASPSDAAPHAGQGEAEPTIPMRFPPRRLAVLGAVLAAGVSAAVVAPRWIGPGPGEQDDAPAPPSALADPDDDGKGQGEAHGEARSGDEAATEGEGQVDSDGAAGQDGSSESADNGKQGATTGDGNDGAAPPDEATEEDDGADAQSQDESASGHRRPQGDDPAPRPNHAQGDRRAQEDDQAHGGTEDGPKAHGAERPDEAEEAHRPPPRPAITPRRDITVHNARRASVKVQLRCGGETVTAEVAAGATSKVDAPRGDCSVLQCTGTGNPRCPLKLRTGNDTLTVR